MTTQHTPETIRALLDGITAGEWTADPPRFDGKVNIFGVVGGAYLYDVAVVITPERDAAFIAASPGIARYALELAAENERLRQILADVREIERKAALVLAQEAVYARTEKELTPKAPTAILEASKLLVDIEIACMALGLPLKTALAPQPAPTDGGGLELSNDG